MLLRENRVSAFVLIVWAASICTFAGCGTTRTSNTLRTATEQLLISDAVDRAVQSIDFSPLAGESIYFDDRRLYDAVDDAYLISSLRQHLLASGCILKEERAQATFVVEPRAGAVGTDNHDLLFGVPATNVPQLTLLAGLPPAIPEIPIAKRRNQRGVAKIAVFAYRRDTGEPAWQSGITTGESTANDIWVLGAGPFKRGTIYKGTSFAGRKLSGRKPNKQDPTQRQVVHLEQEAIFHQGLTPSATPTEDAEGEVQQAAVNEPLVSQNLPQEETVSGEVAKSAGPPVLPPP